MRPHVAVQQPQVGELLPQVAGHLVQQRALAVDHFVVRERQDEVLVEGVDQAEGQLVVVVLAVDRLVPHVADRVVHPAHVPLEAEAQAAQVGGPRDARPGGRFLGDRQDAGELQVRLLVELLEEADGLQVLASAELVGQPIARLAAVVEIEHRGHGVDAQPVDVVLVEPEQGVGDEEVADLVAAVVEDQRAPVAMLAAARIGMLVQVPCRRTAAGRGRRAGSGRAPSPGSRRCRSDGRRSMKYMKSCGVP